MTLRGHEVQDAAITWLLGVEREAGREPKDARYVKGFPGDISSPPRTIEVKAFGRLARADGFLWMEITQVDAGRTSTDFYVYLVENVGQGDPALFTLKVLHGERLKRLLERAREKHYYEVPLPVAEYDNTPDGLI